MPRQYPPIPVPRIALTMPEVATALGIGKSSVYRLAREGEIPLTRIGGRTLVMVDDLTTLLQDGKALAPLKRAFVATEHRVMRPKKAVQAAG